MTDLARRRAYRRLDHGSTRQNLATARPNLSPETQHFITIFDAAQLKRIDADESTPTTTTVNGGGKVSHVGGSIIDLRLSTLRRLKTAPAHRTAVG